MLKLDQAINNKPSNKPIGLNFHRNYQIKYEFKDTENEIFLKVRITKISE